MENHIHPAGPEGHNAAEGHQNTEEHHPPGSSEHPKKPLMSRIKSFYLNSYRILNLITAIILLLAILQIVFQIASTGDFVQKGVSLKGGVSLTIPTTSQIGLGSLKSALSSAFPAADISIRSFTSHGSFIGFSVDADIDANDDAIINKFIAEIGKSTGLGLTKGSYSIESIGSSLGSSFFREVFKAMLLAFVFMSIVVIIYFRKTVPAFIVILCVISDILATLAVVNLLGIKLNTGGIAAFLMLIGYSVDTDMLLSTRMLRRKDLSMDARILSSVKTGMMMTATTLVAVLIALIFSQSEVIIQIMTILFIGLIMDMLFTWIQNMSILRIYVEYKEKHQNAL